VNSSEFVVLANFNGKFDKMNKLKLAYIVLAVSVAFTDW
jgi:hypothetical protein